jgi:hypothetical protein
MGPYLPPQAMAVGESRSCLNSREFVVKSVTRTKNLIPFVALRCFTQIFSSLIRGYYNADHRYLATRMHHSNASFVISSSCWSKGLPAHLEVSRPAPSTSLRAISLRHYFIRR